jgi:hypothetical protein
MSLVLVIDDDAQIRRMARRILSGQDMLSSRRRTVTPASGCSGAIILRSS